MPLPTLLRAAFNSAGLGTTATLINATVQATSVHTYTRKLVAPAVEVLTETLNKLSFRVQEAEQQGSAVEELGDLLANLDITPGEPASETALPKRLRFGQQWKIRTMS